MRSISVVRQAVDCTHHTGLGQSRMLLKGGRSLIRGKLRDYYIPDAEKLQQLLATWTGEVEGALVRFT
jgi:hypothetical protein